MVKLLMFSSRSAEVAVREGSAHFSTLSALQAVSAPRQADFFAASRSVPWVVTFGFMVLYYTNDPLGSVFVVDFSTSYPWLVRQNHEERELRPGGGMLHKAQLFHPYLFMIRCGVGVLHLKGNGLCF